jgi:hypothetical protein
MAVSLYGQPHLVYTPSPAGTPVDLSGIVRPGVTFDSPIETVEDPVLSDPARSRTRAGAATVAFTLVVSDDWATTVEACLGTAGELKATVPDASGSGFSADVTWPDAYPVSFTEEGFVEVEMVLGAGNIAHVAGTVLAADEQERKARKADRAA